jgi:hypothetical protein
VSLITEIRLPFLDCFQYFHDLRVLFFLRNHSLSLSSMLHLILFVNVVLN